jgi:hypothetical protein
MFLQQYMAKVQEQKHGTSGSSLRFLDEPSKKPAAMQADEDMGFDEMQMRILEDTEQVIQNIHAV